MTTAAPLEIQIWHIGRLVLYARNPRKNDVAVDRMCSSIREFGFKIPVLARSDGEVADGHLRLKAARKLRMTEVPVILCDEWSAAQVKAFRLIVNRSVTWASWDDELLSVGLTCTWGGCRAPQPTLRRSGPRGVDRPDGEAGARRSVYALWRRASPGTADRDQGGPAGAGTSPISTDHASASFFTFCIRVRSFHNGIRDPTRRRMVWLNQRKEA